MPDPAAGGAPESGAGAPSRLPLLLSCLAFSLIVWNLWQLDYTMARSLRAVHVPWLELGGNVGNRIGEGLTLTLFSLILAGIGWWWPRASWAQAGLHGLVAQGVTAVVVNTLKHLIGRPRPRLMHGDSAMLGPSFQSGLDSFPSGHSAATFAVATAMARHFPRGAAVFYGVACFVAASRILRGSHFPTDTLVGATIGFLLGRIVTAPLAVWRRSLTEAVVLILPSAWACFALLWVAVHPQTGTLFESAGMWAGGALLVLGCVGRHSLFLEGGKLVGATIRRIATPVALFGLALLTGDPVVIVPGGLVGLALLLSHWEEHTQASATQSRSYALVTMACIFLALLLVQLRGVFPFAG
jgi:undecaprenyl-diphosphatase